MASAPSSPKTHHSASSTPGAAIVQNQTTSTTTNHMTMSMGENGTIDNGENVASNRNSSIMSRSMEGPRSLPPQSPARPHSNNSTLDRR